MGFHPAGYYAWQRQHRMMLKCKGQCEDDEQQLEVCCSQESHDVCAPFRLQSLPDPLFVSQLDDTGPDCDLHYAFCVLQMQECMTQCKEKELLRRDAGPEEEHAGTTQESRAWSEGGCLQAFSVDGMLKLTSCNFLCVFVLACLFERV